MIASPTSTAGFDDRDPWDWTTEEVANVLCSPDHVNFPEPSGFARAIRENRVWGGALLVDVTYSNLKDELGVVAMGERSSVLMLIRNLRLRSAKYRQHAAQEASSLAALSHAAPSIASPFPGSYPTPQFNFPLMRYLTEPMEPPRSREAFRLPMGPPMNAGHVDANRLQAEELQIPNVQPPEDRSDRSYSPPPVLDHTNEAVLPPRSRSSGSPGADENFSEHPDKRSSLEPENSRILRPGEMYLTDETGHKRRKLWLGASDIMRNDPVDAKKTSGEVEVDITTAGHQAPGDFTQLANDVPRLSVDLSIQVTIDDAGEVVIDPKENTSANQQLPSPEVVSATQKINETAEDNVAFEVDMPINSHLLSPEALSEPTHLTVSVADTPQPTEETGSALHDDQSTTTDGLVPEQEDSAWQPEVVEAVHQVDSSSGIRLASPDSSAALKDLLSKATGILEQSDVEKSSGLGQLDTVDLRKDISPKPGVVVVDSNGRKRLMPTLIVQPSVEQPDEQSPISVPSPSAGGTETLLQISALEGNQGQAAAITSTPSHTRKREPSQMYLGPKALPVDEIFYGDTAIGEKITYQESHHALAPLGIDTEHPDNWVTLPADLFPNGQRSYVNNRMKFYLSTKPFLIPITQHQPQSRYGVVPYPTRILKMHLPPSLTLFSSSTADDGATRARRPAWLADDGTGPSTKASQNQSDGFHNFDLPQDSLLSQLGENKMLDFDCLEKWKYQENGQDELPVYGDSSSEGDYDLDTWQEVDEEQSNELERPVGKSRGTHLTADAVLEIIEETIELMAEEWKTNKLPLLVRKAWRLWVRSRRDKTSQNQIVSSVKEIAKLEHRLTKLKKELQGELWSNTLQLKKQCKCLQITINDLEASRWKVNILQLKQAPPKPETPPGKHASRKGRKVESLADSEEELRSSESADESSGSDLDGFIVEDNMVSDNSGDDEFVGMSPDDDDEDVSAQVSSDTVAHSDDPADYGDDIIGTSVLKKHSDSPTRSTPNSLLPDLDDLITDESTTPGDLLGGVTNKEEPSETQSQLEVNSTKSPAKQGVTLTEVIDLTQLSDLDEPEVPKSSTPKIKEESYRIRTPPRDNTDPFNRARKAKPEFRDPPMAFDIVDLENWEQSQDEKASQKVPSPSEQLPGLWELSKIRALKWELLAERQDRRRLLTWIMLHTSDEALEDVLTATQHQTSAEIQPTIWAGLKAIKGHATKVRKENSKGIMQVTSWYISWHNCKKFSEYSGIPRSCVQSTMDNETGFEEFYNFMLEIFSKLEADRLSKPSTSSTRGPYNKKRQVRLDGDPETRSRPHKKRKYVVPESQEAAELRFNAQERAREREERQALLKEQLKSSGVDLGNASAMIVNGKSGEEMITINPTIAGRIQQHQLDGIQFMWGEIISEQAEMQGCLLAHTMGLGKTMQVITLLSTIADASNNPSEAIRNQIPECLRESCTLVLCPPGLVENWSDELLLWISDESSRNIGPIRKISAKLTPKDRLFEITAWNETGGVLLLGYSMFKSFVLGKSKTKSEEKSRGLNEEEYQRVSTILLERPNIVVADEAHAAKTMGSNLTQAIAKIRSRSRIALTGSPLANNLEEYYSLIEWIAPGYLGSRPEFRAKYVEPISEGLFADATQWEQRKGLKMLRVLNAELAPKVHRLDISVLKKLLPGKTEFLLRVPLTDLQREAYSIYARHMLNASATKEPGSAALWAWLAILVLLCNHPLCFINKIKEKHTDPKPQKQQSNPLSSPAREAADPLGVEENANLLLEGSVASLGISETMVEQQILLFKKVSVPLGSVDLSYKMHMLFQILKLSVAVGDKVLVFSHSLPTLDYIEGLLSQMGYKYARLDGKTSMQTRQQLTKDFNKDMDVCLISTRAGGQGLNMAGANRVVIMDSHFNPMHDEQAIGRAYRIGQKKHVYVYRLITGETFEQALHDQSLFKTQLATRVVDKKNPVRHALKGARQYLFLPKRVSQEDLKGFKGDSEVLDKILIRQESKPVVRSIALTETFHEEVFEPLTAEEEKEADQLIEEEQLRRTDPEAYSKLIQRKQAIALNAPAMNQEQSLGRGPGLETTALYPSTIGREMPGANVSEADRMASIPSSSYMPPPHVARSVQTSGSATTLTDRQAVPTPVSDKVTATVQGVHTSIGQATAQRVTTPIGQVTNMPNIQPVLGLNTQVEQRSLSESLEGHGSPTMRTPSRSVRAESEPVNERLSNELRHNRETVRRHSKSIIEAAIQKQVELGQIVVTSVPDIAEILATSVEKHAYGGAKNEAQYDQILKESLTKCVRLETSRALIDKAEERLEEKSAKSRRSARPSLPPPSPVVSNSGESPLAQGVSDRSKTPTTSKDGETVGSLVHSALSKPPNLAPFPSLAGMMQREANRKTG
ncbi:hypothetical protein MMC30_005383 [Trapelia coarctata]|nr:hypothetical protein [Trapelia coarctata]